MEIGRSNYFKEAWKQLPENDRKQAIKAINGIVEYPRYPSLRVKKLKGTDQIWEARASHSLRITFEIVKDKIILRNIGKHDDVFNQP